MPVVLRISGFKFYFFSNEGSEPVHVHVRKGNGEGKIWLEPEIKEEYMIGYTVKELKQIREIVNEHGETIKSKWHEYFGK